jgi:bifunctional DNA-binding transcriptional regulator/antitoxin component of YhaV-PrlF toxin-antitoxin module
VTPAAASTVEPLLDGPYLKYRSARWVAATPAAVTRLTGSLAPSSLLPYFLSMLAKLTAKNQLTLPKHALEALGMEAAPTHFQVEVEDGRIVLTPARIASADAVRRKLADLGVTEADVTDAVAWARQRP